MEPRTARAVDHGCELYKVHVPKPVRTEGHHRHPVYLQNQVYGRIQDPELLWVCGNCHDAIHEWLSWLLGDARKPEPEPGRKAKAEAQRSYDWFTAARP